MSYIALANITLTSNQTSVTFSNIPTSVNGTALRDLVLVASVRPTTTTDIGMRFNGDTGSNYHRVWAAGNGSSASSGTNSPDAWYYWAYTDNDSFDTQICQIMDYSATDKHKSALSRYGGASITAGMTAGRWANTSAITSITITLGTYQTGSTFALYGIAG